MQELREIRDKISLETMDMSFEELQEYWRTPRSDPHFELRSGRQQHRFERR